AAFVLPARAPQTGVPRLNIEQLIDIKHPSNPMWSPDGRHVAFLWDRAGVGDWYIVDVDGKGAQPHVALHNDSATGVPKWNADSQSLVPSGQGGAGVTSPDGTRVAVAREGDLIVRSVATGAETHMARESSKVSGLSWSPDGAYLLFTSGGGPIRHEQTPAYSGSKIIYTITENAPGQSYAVRAQDN